MIVATNTLNRRMMRGYTTGAHLAYDFVNPFVAASEAQAVESMYLTLAFKRYLSVVLVLGVVGGGVWYAKKKLTKKK